jgi:hypothetical protein
VARSFIAASAPFSGPAEMSEAIRVTGLRELNRAFAECDKELKRELARELKAAGEPVRAAAQGFAASRIRNIGPSWSQMKVGATAKSVYVAPKARRRGGSRRPNLGPLLLDRAMEPALDAKSDEVVKRLDGMLDRVGRRAGF